MLWLLLLVNFDVVYAISKLSKRRNLYMTGEVVQSEGFSREFS